MCLAAFNARTSAHCRPRRVSGSVLACGRARDRVATDAETGVPRAAVVRLTLIVGAGHCRARPRLERRVDDLPLLHRPADVE